ncbi:MAG TPA: hypothetical protein VGO67_09460 [Verrucomicrobiae bacterium]|jgi:hypothetical protein
MSNLYNDSLVEVTDQEIVFHRYSFPFASDKRVPLTEIESVEARWPSALGGSWRIWGSSDFRTWFPLDAKRPGRDRIFIATLRNKFRRIGFTVEDSRKLEEVLKERGLLRKSASS